MIWLILIIIGESLLTSLTPYSRGLFFQSLQSKQEIYYWLWIFGLNSFGIDLIQSFKGYFVTKYSLTKRKWLTTKILNRRITDSGIENIEQRVQEDIKLMYQNRYTVFIEYFISGLILMSIILTNIDHYWLILGALSYAFISILIAFLFNDRMCSIEKTVQRNEADYRRSIFDFRLFDICLTSNYRSAKIKLEYTLFTKLQNAILLVLPYLILLPEFLLNKIGLGDLMKVATMFGLVVLNADVLIALYPTLVIAKASKDRVKELI